MLVVQIICLIIDGIVSILALIGMGIMQYQMIEPHIRRKFQKRD